MGQARDTCSSGRDRREGKVRLWLRRGKDSRSIYSLVMKTEEISAQGSGHVNSELGRDFGSLRAKGLWRH